MTENIYCVLLSVAAFWLGACPFSLWIGRWLLGKDIRDYGDANPGAANVFRAGDIKTGLIALALDVAKGSPFVFMAHAFFGLSGMAVMTIGVSAILGHAFSPVLKLRGGKAIAVTFGVLMALPEHEVLLAFVFFICLGFLCIEPDSWTVMLAPAGALAYLGITGGGSWESLFMLSVLVIFAIKQYSSLRNAPRFRVKPIGWYQSRSRGT